MRKRSLRRLYSDQKRHARARNIAWELTFDEWLSIWQASGKLAERGAGKDQFVMARMGDVGPYSVENVYICTASQNHKDAHHNKRWHCGVPIGRGRGWTFIPGRKTPYQVMLRRKHIGAFKTQEEAEAAYRSAVQHDLRTRQAAFQ